MKRNTPLPNKVNRHSVTRRQLTNKRLLTTVRLLFGTRGTMNDLRDDWAPFCGCDVFVVGLYTKHIGHV